MAVELGGISLEHLTAVAVREETRIARHSVPGMQGDLAQVLGRPSVEVSFQGIFFGPGAADELAALRRAAAEQRPVDFFTEAVSEGYFAQVLITALHVGQRAGYLDQFDYSCTVREYVEPPAPALADPLGGLDAGLLDEAAAFMDDVQDAIAAVSALADLVANGPAFGDPTTRVAGMLDEYRGLLGAGSTALDTLNRLKELLG